MTKAMPFLQKVILLSYDPRPFVRGRFFAVSMSQASRAVSCSRAAGEAA